MASRPLQTPPFKVEWRGDIHELRSLLDDHTLQYVARVGPVESLKAKYHVVELTPQNRANQEMVENYFSKTKPPNIRRRRSFPVTEKPRSVPVIPKSQRISYVSPEEHGKRMQEQMDADRLSEIDRLNIFPPGSDKHPCFNIRHGIKCKGTMELEQVRSPTYALAFLMWTCLICRDSVDKIVLQNRGVKIEDHKKATKGRKKRAVASAKP